MTRATHRTYWLILAALALCAWGIARAGDSSSTTSGQSNGAALVRAAPAFSVAYWFPPSTPRKVRLAAKVAGDAWTKQTGIKFQRAARWTDATLVIVWCPLYGSKGLGMHYDWGYPWVGGPPGTLACCWNGKPSYIYINASRAEGERWKWVNDNSGRNGKVCGLQSALMHELGHVCGCPDLPAGIKSVADPLDNRDSWNVMYGRMWPKLTLTAADLSSIGTDQGGACEGIRP